MTHLSSLHAIEKHSALNAQFDQLNSLDVNSDFFFQIFQIFMALETIKVDQRHLRNANQCKLPVISVFFLT